MKLAFFTAVLVSLFLMSCTNEPSLQKYFVEKSENKDFVLLDVSPGIIDVDKAKLSSEQQSALASFDKMNILVFKSNQQNAAQYQSETQKVGTILKGKDYQELIKIGSGKDGASVSFVGEEDNIDEFVFFAKSQENGFAVVRILGNDMNPNNIMNMISVLQSANIDMEQLKPLQGLLK
ncbi:DUF4252 domain-containing protein [Flavobacterium sp.]|uniref:DUF4252 domain-containing protein n=1 Tax=Flavobacterium sp. TaxID=239 RepID=UPI0025F24FFF|nr:DUF4252 domain-containing protein [Flavobacterium sp.]